MSCKKMINFLKIIVLIVLTTASLGTVLPVSAAADDAQADTGEKQAVSPAELFSSLLARAEKGNSRAMLAVGAMCEQGIGIPKNLSNALEWYEKAGKAGEGEGFFRAGLCYEVGMGTGQC
jgi:TPR repeat protein